MNTPIKQFTRPNIRILRNEIDQALASIAAKYDINIQAGRGSFSETNLSLKLELSAKNASGVVVTKEAAAFTQGAHWLGMKAEWLGTTFEYFGKTYTITGLNSRLSSHGVPTPVLAERNGKGYKFSERVVIEYKTGKRTVKPTVTDFVVGPKNPDHAEIVKRLTELRNDNPEAYYADGERRGTEKQIYNEVYRMIAREIERERNGTQLFKSTPVPPPPPVNG